MQLPRLVSSLALATIALTPAYLIRFHIGSFPSTLLEVLILATVIAWVAQKIRTREPIQKLPRVFLVIVVVFLLAATISIFTAPDIRAALGVWRAYFVEPLLFFLVVRDLLATKQLTAQAIIKILALPALLISAYTIFQRFTGFGIPYPWDAERRVTSIFPFPNAVGLFLAPLIPLFISQAILHRKKIIWFVYFLLATVFSSIAIYFAHSMGAIVGLGGGVVIAGIIYLVKTRRWKTLAAAVLMIAVLGTTLLQIKPLYDELLLKDWSGTVRKIGWQETITMLQVRPLLGAGLSGFPTAVAPYHKATAIEIFQYPHNIFLNFWSETGLLGTTSFFALIGYFFFVLLRKKQLSRMHRISLICSMAVILIHGLVDVPYFKNDLAVVFWLMYALALETN